MKILIASFAAAILATTLPAASQEGPVTEKDIIRPDRQPINGLKPAPENGNILVGFGQYVRIYFKHPIKSAKLTDEFTVRAVPETDHIIRFTGISPGETSVTIEQTDGTETEWGIVTAVREPHEVKIYTPTPGRGREDTRNSLMTVVNENSVQSVESRDQPDYRTILCNEVGCKPLPPPEK